MLLFLFGRNSIVGPSEGHSRWQWLGGMSDRQLGNFDGGIGCNGEVEGGGSGSEMTRRQSEEEESGRVNSSTRRADEGEKDV
ncbi:hypothetical protein KFK09_002628 [Dendrobium nobile]|uniref:Uncharacterized protein n=1 Tax=Dendrobium nobile TaxID=94219 RepID=A0A8T3C7D5_DENNO|nr:hypothetical protein KFK09_002628 [Dendrobium nobile]